MVRLVEMHGGCIQTEIGGQGLGNRLMVSLRVALAQTRRLNTGNDIGIKEEGSVCEIQDPVADDCEPPGG